MKKRICTMFLAIALILSIFSGCGTTEKSDSQASSAAKTSGSAAVSTPEGQIPVNLTFWWAGSGPNSENYVKKACEMIHEKYNYITVDGSSIAWNDYPTKLNVAFAGGTAPELFALGFNQLYANASNVMVLNDHIKDWDGWNDIDETILNYGKIDDKFYGFLYPEIKLMTYRKDFFKEAGLDPNTPPSTKEEMYEYAKKLTVTDKNGNIQRAGFELPTTGGDQGYFPLLLMFGVDKFWDDNYDLTLNQPEALEAAKYAKSFFDGKAATYSDQHSVQGSLFENGITAMSLSISSAYYAALDQKIGFDKIGVAIPPSGKVLTAGSFISIYKNAKNVDAAVKAWEVLSSKEAMLMIAKEMGFVPTRASARDEYIAMNKEINSIVYEGMTKAAVYGKANPYFYDFRDTAFNPHLEEMYYGKITPEECLKQTIEQYDELRKASKK